ncbi:MAG: WhiB family transcriptional regulator [Streptosporangiaceae bacterium]
MALKLTEAAAASACSVPTHRGPCVMTRGHADRFHRAVPRMPLEYARARAFECGQSPAARPADPLSDPALPCRSMDPELFFPVGKKKSADPAALRACAACPARNACLDRALEMGEIGPDSGIWGGTTHLERRRLLRLAGAA